MDYVKKAWLNGLFFIVTLVVNALGAFGLINGSSQKEVSDKYLTLITPDPSTFSIWSVIYLFLTLSIVFMIWKKEDAYYQAAINKISSLFIFSSILNMAWIIAFSFEQLVLSTIFILVFAVTLTLICLQLLKMRRLYRTLESERPAQSSQIILDLPLYSRLLCSSLIQLLLGKTLLQIQLKASLHLLPYIPL